MPRSLDQAAREIAEAWSKVLWGVPQAPPRAALLECANHVVGAWAMDAGGGEERSDADLRVGASLSIWHRVATYREWPAAMGPDVVFRMASAAVETWKRGEEQSR